MWRLERQFDRARRGHVPGPHWYLLLLGVDPAARRRGLARAALRPVLDAADRDGLPCYLETQDGANVPAYARLGFAVVGRRRVAGGLWNWELTRRPVTAFTDPEPQIRGITSQYVTYKRKDGVTLSGTLYLPPDYQKGAKVPRRR